MRRADQVVLGSTRPSRSDLPRSNPNRVEAVHLDDVVIADQVQILTPSGLAALRPPDADNLNATTTVDHVIARPDIAGDRDLR